jgi:hypothetical protein
MIRAPSSLLRAFFTALFPDSRKAGHRWLACSIMYAGQLGGTSVSESLHRHRFGRIDLVRC